MEKLTDAEIVARLIYKAFVAPDLTPGERLSEDALITWPMALKLYAKLAHKDYEKDMSYKTNRSIRGVPEAAACIADGIMAAFSNCPTTAFSPPTTKDNREQTESPQPLTDNIKGQGTEEKKEIHADLMAFIGRHGIGARKMIADASKGKLTLSDVMDLTDCKQKPLSAWRAARDAMFNIEDDEK